MKTNRSHLRKSIDIIINFSELVIYLSNICQWNTGNYLIVIYWANNVLGTVIFIDKAYYRVKKINIHIDNCRYLMESPLRTYLELKQMGISAVVPQMLLIICERRWRMLRYKWLLPLCPWKESYFTDTLSQHIVQVYVCLCMCMCEKYFLLPLASYLILTDKSFSIYHNKNKILFIPPQYKYTEKQQKVKKNKNHDTKCR